MTKYPFQIATLPSGLQVITGQMHHMESVSIGVWARVGGRYEDPTSSGISHFIEHMNFKGTPRRTARKISQAIESIGGIINGFTGEEATCYYAKVRYPKFNNALEVVLDLYFNSTFDPAEISRERDVIKEEIRMYSDVPQQLVYEDFNTTMWPDHPLGQSLLGTFDSIDSFTRRKLLAFRNQYYTPANTIISVAGNISHDAVVAAVEKCTAGMKKGKPAPECSPFRTAQRSPRLHVRTKQIEQAHAIMGFRTSGRNDPQRFQLRLLSTILGENMSSRLNHEIREKRGLAYSIHSQVSRYQDTGALQITIGTDAQKLPQALSLILAMCRSIAEKGVKPIELRHAKEFVRGNVGLALERTTDHMIWLGEGLLISNDVLTIEDIINQYNRVTLDDIQRIAQQVFVKKGLNLAIVTPSCNTRQIKSLLRQ
jgi:predicted Zn-dependent peptidase